MYRKFSINYVFPQYNVIYTFSQLLQHAFDEAISV